MPEKHMQLKCLLDDDEQRDLGKKLASEINRLDDAENEKKSITSYWKSEIDSAKALVLRISTILSNGYENRDVACIIKYHDPKDGEKTVYRKDTGELISTSEMSNVEHDDAMRLFQDEASELAIGLDADAGPDADAGLEDESYEVKEAD